MIDDDLCKNLANVNYHQRFSAVQEQERAAVPQPLPRAPKFQCGGDLPLTYSASLPGRFIVRCVYSPPPPVRVAAALPVSLYAVAMSLAALFGESSDEDSDGEVAPATVWTQNNGVRHRSLYCVRSRRTVLQRIVPLSSAVACPATV